MDFLRFYAIMLLAWFTIPLVLLWAFAAPFKLIRFIGLNMGWLS
jgi:hypothetical protein